MDLLRRKSVLTHHEYLTNLRRCLSVTDLTLMGIGAIIGAGIFVITGVAAATQAGPAIIFSYIVAGLACVFTALSYAELASSIGGCGSAYGYAYVGFGELIAWIIGWDLVLEYGISTAAVAIGWSSYMNDTLRVIGCPLPDHLMKGPTEGGIVNLMAMVIVIFVSILLCIGVRQSARFNALMVVVKLIAIGLFISVAIFHINPANWQPFMPFGWSGIMQGAALIFFAYIGFDAVSTAAEEAVDPQRDVPRGIIFSLLVCTLLYIIVAGLLTLVAPYTTLNNASPVSDALIDLGHRVIAGFVAVGAIAGLTTVILVMYYGLTRVFLAMTRDGLLPDLFSAIHPRTKTPVRIILLSGAMIAIIAGVTPIDDVAELVNIGTLAAFVIVCGGVIVLRITNPSLKRPFRTPFNPFIPLAGIFFCLYLMVSLPLLTWLRFIIWCLTGMIIYFTYGRFHSILNKDVSKV